MLVPKIKPRLFLLFITAASVALVGYSGWLLWPVYQERRSVQELLQAVRSGNQEAVDRSVVSVKKFRGKGVDAIPELAKLLSDTNAGIRWRATYAIGELAEAATDLAPSFVRDAAVPALIAGLSDEDIRIRAAFALGQIGSEA